MAFVSLFVCIALPGTLSSRSHLHPSDGPRLLVHSHESRHAAPRSHGKALLNLTRSKSPRFPLSSFAVGKKRLRPASTHRIPVGNITGFGVVPGYRNSSGYVNMSYDDLFNSIPKKEQMPLLMALGGGTGASVGGTGNHRVDRDLLQRMHYQDKAVMLLVLAIYMVALWLSATLTYRQASNRSPVTYYADPRFHSVVMEGHDLDTFLETFNQAPKNITLQVTGFLPVPDEMMGSVQWRGENFQVAFTFSLDLSPWVERATRTGGTGPNQQVRSLHDGVLPEHRSILSHHLALDNNDLSYIELVKEVEWPDWEELATNIKHQIRQSGFNGVITVNRGETDEMHIYKNKAWANFMHARATRVLCALSIFGWIFYVPYMWWRCQTVSLKSYYRVDMSISDYWRLISDKLSADGFVENGPVSTNA